MVAKKNVVAKEVVKQNGKKENLDNQALQQVRDFIWLFYPIRLDFKELH